MRVLFTLARRLERLTAFDGKLAGVLLLVMMLVIVGDVTLRHFFTIGSTFLQELEWHLNAAAFLLALGWAYSQGAHVRIELVSSRLSMRRQAWIELAAVIALLLPFLIAVLVFSVDYTLISFSYNESSASPLGLPWRWAIKAMIPTGVLLLALVAIARALDAVVYLFAKPDLAAKTCFAIPHDQAGAS